METKKLTDTEFIHAHLTKPKKIYQGRWCMSFTTADGYCYSAEEEGNLRHVKPKLAEKITELALRGATRHPIQ